MGQFSWITQDTFEPIREKFGCSYKPLTTAYMHDNKGNVWEETEYEGYGEFGGKDYYQLVAEMNRPEHCNGDVDHDRSIGIDIAFSGFPFLSPHLTRNRAWTWKDEEPARDPNQGWGSEEDDEDFNWYEEE